MFDDSVAFVENKYRTGGDTYVSHDRLQLGDVRRMYEVVQILWRC